MVVKAIHIKVVDTGINENIIENSLIINAQIIEYFIIPCSNFWLKITDQKSCNDNINVNININIAFW